VELDVVWLSRLQFAITVGFHFLFPPISIGLAWLLVIIERRAMTTGDPKFEKAGRFFGSLLGLTFAMGVATGIVMEFQFGTNWAQYSKFVGDIFGAPLAAEALFAFFLESAFLGLYLFGRGRISKRLHWFSILMVAVGATISAFWILVANSWQQTPAGYAIQNGRAELTSFWQAVFNPSTAFRFFHTILAALATGAFFMIGVGAFILLRAPQNALGRLSLRYGVLSGLVFSVLTAFPTGHEHARQVARTQPEKFAAIEGLYMSQSQAPLVLFAYPVAPPPQLKARIEIKGLLSWMAFGDIHAEIKGIDEFPADEIPPLWMTFVSFHNMVVLGMLFIAATGWGALQLWRGKLFEQRWFLWILFLISPLPLAACQLGWVTAEVGRQPWIVYRELKTAEAFSPAVTGGEVLFSMILFSLLYLALLALYLFLIWRKSSLAASEGAEERPATR